MSEFPHPTGRHAPAGRADSTATGLGAQACIRSRSPGWWHLWWPRRETTGLATRHQASGTTGQTLATTTTARSLQWNKIEHRLFSHITFNWRGRPLVSHQVIVELIGATRTRSGLRVQAELDRGSYPLGVKVADRELAAVPLRRHDWHGEWNYTVLPTAA